MKVVCKECKNVVDNAENDFCHYCGADLKNAVTPVNEKEMLRYTALKNKYEGEKKELFMYLFILGGVLVLAVLWFILEKAV